MDKSLKNILIGTGFGVSLFVVLTNIGPILEKMQAFLALMQPIVMAGVLAFVLNVPMSGIEAGLTKLLQKRKPGKGNQPAGKKPLRLASLLLTLALVVVIIGLMVGIVLPQMVTSTMTAVQQIRAALPNIEQELHKAGIDAAWLSSFDLSALDGPLVDWIHAGLGGAANVLIGTISSTAGTLLNLLLAMVFTIYFLLDKEMLARQSLWLLRKIFPPKAANGIRYVARRLQDTYMKFFGGQCLEALLLGAMMFMAFTLCRLPYGGLIAVLTAVTSFIPYVGSFLSCAVAAVLIVLTNPWQALLAVVVYQVVQFCENQFVYPRVVGSAVGLPPLYTMMAVFVGGALFGVIGMIFFIPLTATCYSLAKDWQ